MDPKAIIELQQLVFGDRGIWLSPEAIIRIMQDMETVFEGKYEGGPENL